MTLQSDVAWPALPSKTVHKISGVVGQGFNYPGVSSATNVGIQSGPSTVALSFNDFDSENKKFNFASVGKCFVISGIGYSRGLQYSEHLTVFLSINGDRNVSDSM